MANTITAKTLGKSGSSRRNGGRVVVYVDTAGTLDSEDFTFTYQVRNLYPDGRGTAADSDFVNVVHNFKPTLIESIINMGENPITIDGKVFETGRWELSQHGGLPVANAKGNIVITGTAPSCLIELRS
jgi:hypothetical protein